MIITFRYSVVHDLMFHILSHMQVANASNLYSEAYIDHINSIKNGRYDSITAAAAHLSDYYNANFERLGVVNFLPLVSSSVQDLIGALENYCGFSATDKEAFISPFIQLFKRELAFYEDYWNKLHNTTAPCRKAFEAWLENEMSKYEALFAYFNKSAEVCISYSLTSNGRGYGDASAFHAVVPFAFDESSYKNTFYQILHEYTHQFTDELLGERIRMDDSTHDLSERAVLLFDDYLIRKLCKEDTASYLKWVGSLAHIDPCDEDKLLSAFKINDDVNEKLLALASRF